MQYSEMQLLQRMRYNAYCNARINTMPCPHPLGVPGYRLCPLGSPQLSACQWYIRNMNDTLCVLEGVCSIG